MTDQRDQINPWHDDVLERGNLAQVLERHLMARFEATGGAPMSIAVDGNWGSGKTFFVNRWTKQLHNSRCCVIEFDAWQHDHAVDPSLAFMAEISRQIRERMALLIDSDATMEAIESALDNTIDHMKRAAKPLAKAIFGAAVKRVVGLSIGEIKAAVASQEDEPSFGEESTANGGDRMFDQAIDKYLDQTLIQHEVRKASVAEFRSSLERLAKSLVSASAGPVFVVIDELDRCRPDFAVRLLEGVKHLFSVPNVCFVFSTNLSQLAASVQAIYGPNFDGRDYLGRFFEQELRLPVPTNDQFARLLFRQIDKSNEARRHYGRFYFPHYSEETRGSSTWAGLSEAMGVTLRQQQQAFTTFTISCESYPRGTIIPAMWLMFLCLLHRSHPSAFSDLYRANRGWDLSKFLTTISRTSWQDQPLQDSQLSITHPSARGSLGSVLYQYFYVSKMAYPEDISYVANNAEPAVQEFSMYLTGPAHSEGLSKLHLPFSIIATAGLFSYGTHEGEN